MGCDIHTYAEKKTSEGFEIIDGLRPFQCRSYGTFGFLAGVRNYSEIPPIAEPRGLPVDACAHVHEEAELWESDAHTHSWLCVDELIAFDYEKAIEDRRVTMQTGSGSWSGACTCVEGEGRITTYREFLGEEFFRDIEKLKLANADRIVFWFDN